MALAFASLTYAATLPQQLNHSFDVDAATVVACTDGAVFTGAPTAASALNILFTAQVWNGTGTTLLASGDTHTFTAIGEKYTFTVPGSFTVGSTIVVQANNIPGTFPSTEGDAATATVANCSISVPTVPGAGLLLFALVLAAGGAVLVARRKKAVSFRAGTLALGLMVAAAAATLGSAPADASEISLPSFSKAFMPDTIGPGSTSMLIFTINNGEHPQPVGDLAFDDALPFGLALAEPAFVSNDCGGIVTIDDDDADSAFDIRLTGGMVAQGASCTVVVNVTGSTPSEVPYVNISGDLTSNAGNSGTATAGLTITDALPGFTKAFLPATVPFGGRSTLTFTIDNTDNGSDVEQLFFTDNLPPGMVVADPANASTDCGDPLDPAELTADPGTSVVELFSLGSALSPSLEAGMICTVVVDVVGGAAGALGNVSGELSATIGGDAQSAGKAAAVLEVDGFTSLLALEKTFTDDPVPPGGTVTLQFTVRNLSRDDAATAITFSDTIDPMGGLTGLAPAEMLPKAVCGGTVDLVGSDLVLTGGSLPVEGSCTFSVALAVPTGATAGTYTNSTSTISGDVGGSPETGDGAVDQLFVVAFPLLTKVFTDDPVGAGGTATLEFTITNTASSAITEIEFFDALTEGSVAPMGFLPYPVTIGLPPVPNPPCNGSSSVALAGNEFDGQGLELTGGELAASDGMPGGMDTCTFTVTVGIPAGFAGGTYTNTTGPISAEVGMSTVLGKSAKGDIVVVGAPQLSKEFTDDPALPGGTATLLFTLENGNLDDAATAIAFDDDLGAALTGLTIASYGSDTCGGTPSGLGTDMFGYSGGSLPAADPGPATCTIELTLDVPDIAGGSFPNETSTVTATVAGVATEGAEAQDTLVVAGLQFSKAFSGDPVIPGGTATLTFTLDNSAGTSPDDDATSIFFTDDLDANLPGLAATTLPALPIPGCGGSSSLMSFSGGTFLIFSGGTVTGGAVCSFSVTVTVPTTIPNPTPPPAGSIPTPDGFYANVTSSLSATIDSTSAFLPPAIDAIEVNSTLLEITKEFLGDPVAPGGSVTLKFTLANLSTTETVTDIEFSDDLDAALSGLEATAASTNDCGGMATSGFPTGLFEYAGGMLDPATTCTITLAVDVPDAPLADAPPFINTTSGVTGKVGALDVFGGPDEDELLIQVLAISKDFTDDPTTATGTVTLEFTLTNLGTTTATDLSFFDNLSTVIPGLVATTLPPVGICGAGSMLTGTSTLSFTGGSLAGDSSCVIPVTLTVPASATAGPYLNATSALREQGLVVAPGATASLEIEPPPTFAKSFAPDSIVAGAVSTLTFTIDNAASTVAANDLSFIDNLPAGVVIANPTNASTTCAGGMGDATPGATSFSFVGGTVGATVSCTVQFNVTSSAGGMYVNTTEDLTSTSGNSGTATDTLTVTPPPPPVFTKAFAPDTIPAGTVSTLTFTIDNSASLVSATGLTFVDNFPADIEIAATPNVVNGCGGMGNPTAGVTMFSYSGGSVGAGAVCTVAFDVTSSTLGSHVNTSGALTSTSGNSGTASDTLVVVPPPTFAKIFVPDTIPAAGVSTLTFTIDNTGSTVAATALDFTDNLPAAVTVATPSGASTTCTGGTLTAVAGTGTITYTGGTVAAGSSCTVAVDVTSSTPGDHVNTSGDLTSSLGNSGTASDTLTVESPPVFTKDFAPDPVVETFETTLTFTIDNTAGTAAATGLAFMDMLPFDLQVAPVPMVASTCGGSVVANPASTTISLSGGTVGAGATCTISIKVLAPSAREVTNTTGDLTSSAGNSGTASDTLTVVSCGAPDGTNLTLENLVILEPVTREACRTISVQQHVQVLGPNGKLTLRAGVAVVIFNGFSVEQNGSELSIVIDPSLTMP